MAKNKKDKVIVDIAFDGRVLKHGVFSGVENYTKLILNTLRTKITIKYFEPVSSNRYIQQLWEHFELPFLSIKNKLLFCPSNLAPIFIPKKTKLVLTLHDVAFKTFPESVSKLFYWYYSFLVPRNIRRADSIITISNSSKKEILRWYPEAEGKIVIIPLGLDEKYRLLPGIQKQKQILYVGSVNERKNLIGVLDAFEMLPKSLGYTLVIVGNYFESFTLSDKLKIALKKAKKNSAICFKQGLNDKELIHEYNVSCCFVFPSFYEGFGLSPLEAMACGTPVITSNLSSMPEVCANAALYINPYYAEDIKEKIQMLLENTILQEELIKKGLEHVKAFTWEKAANEHLTVFEQVLTQ